MITTVLAVGVGRGGYEGLEACWDYTATDAPAGQPLFGTGYIIEAKGKPGDRPNSRFTKATTATLEPAGFGIEAHVGRFPVA